MANAHDHNRSESELWLSFTQGDRDAFSALYMLCYNKLYSYGISLGMTHDQARDAIQELFVKLYSRPSLIREVSTIRAYLFISLKNSFLNHLKIKRRHLALAQMESFDFRYTVTMNENEREEERREAKKRVDAVICRLTPRQKEIIYLRFLCQMDYEEISSIMQLSEQAARNLTHRAMERMRESPDALWSEIVREG